MDLLEVLNGCERLVSVHCGFPQVSEIDFRLNGETKSACLAEAAHNAATAFVRLGDYQAGVHGENGQVFIRFEAFVFTRAQLYEFAERIYNAALAEGKGAMLLPAHTEPQ